VTNDNTVEGSETVVVTLTGPNSGPFVVDGANETATVNIADDDVGQISIAATDDSAAEPSNDGTFTVSLSATNNTGAAITVTYNVDGTATNGSDYQNLSGSVSVANGLSSATIPVNVTNDNQVEGAETVIVTLNGPNSGPFVVDGGNDTDTVTISDDDNAFINVVRDRNASEGAGLNGRFRVGFGPEGSVTEPVSVDYTVNGTASPDADYSALSGTVVVSGGQDSFVAVVPIDDALFEGDETVAITLTATNNPQVLIDVDNGSADLIIADDERPLASAVADRDGAEEPLVDGQFLIRLSAVNDTSTPVEVNYVTSGTAEADIDYVALSGTSIIEPGSRLATVPVEVIVDGRFEGDETVVLNLTGTDHTAVSLDPDRSDATITVRDSTALVGISSAPPGGDPSAAENPAESGAFLISLASDNSTGSPIVVSFNVTGSATLDEDYEALPGNVEIPAGEATASLSVTTTGLDDDEFEGEETVNVRLTGTNVANIQVDPAMELATVVIADDERGRRWREQYRRMPSGAIVRRQR
jgi:hypothetical protein